MAQKVNVLILDDIGGEDGAETVTFGLDGETYEIDLIRQREDELRGTLATYVEHARPVSVSSAPGRARRASGTRATAPRSRRPRSPATTTASATRLVSSVSGTAGRAAPTTIRELPPIVAPVVSEREYLRLLGHDIKERGRVSPKLHQLWVDYLAALQTTSAPATAADVPPAMFQAGE